jgi:hypothetical protein
MNVFSIHVILIIKKKKSSSKCFLYKSLFLVLGNLSLSKIMGVRKSGAL